jgi:hypothetical protein
MALEFTERRTGQYICTRKDEKGKMCSGHLKRWDQPGPEVAREAGAGAEIFRCERCRALYRDRSSEAAARLRVREVNLLGDFKRREP